MVFCIMIRAVILKDILWPQKQEDREEGGWKSDVDEKYACDTRRCGPQSSTRATNRQRRMPAMPDPQAQASRTGSEAFTDPNTEPDTEEPNLPVIAERLVEESVRGRGYRPPDDEIV